MSNLTLELWNFMYSILAGIIISVLFDMFRIKRFVLGAGKLSLILEDVIFWVLTCIVVCSLTFFVYHGEIRAYMFAGIIAGIVIYFVIE